MAVRPASARSGPSGHPDHRARRYFDGRTCDAKWRVRLYREAVFLGATHFRGASSGRETAADLGGSLVEVRPGGPPGHRGEPAGPIAADATSAQAGIHTG